MTFTDENDHCRVCYGKGTLWHYEYCQVAGQEVRKYETCNQCGGTGARMLRIIERKENK